jgi:hypothetical protein
MTSLIQSTISSRTSEYLKSTYSDRQILDIAKQELPTLSKEPEKLSEIIKPKTIESFTYKANREVPLETNKKTTDIEENPIKLEEATRPNIVDRNVLSETDKKTLVLEGDAPKPEEIPVESEKKSGIISGGGWLELYISICKRSDSGYGFKWSDAREKQVIAMFLERHKEILSDKEKNLIAKHFPDHNNYDISRSQANSETDKKTLVLEGGTPKPEEIPVESEKKSSTIGRGGWLGFWISLWKKTCPSWSEGREKKLIARFLELHQFTADGILSDMDSVSTHGVPIKYMLDDKEKNLIAKHFPDHNNYDISRSQANKYKNTRSVLSSDFDDPIKTKFSSIDSMENLNKIYNLYTDIMEKTHYSHSINKIITQMIDSFQRKISD